MPPQLRKYDFAEAQFRSTRDAMCSNWISDIVWGGMQWQLEHHLFPTMPRYKYKVTPSCALMRPHAPTLLCGFASPFACPFFFCGLLLLLAPLRRNDMRWADARPRVRSVSSARRCTRFFASGR
jgi:hypothetical protein